MKFISRFFALAILVSFLATGCATGGRSSKPGEDGGARDGGTPARTDGGCPTPCGAGQECRFGRCVTPCGAEMGCPGLESCCDGVCTTIGNDQLNCGTCGNACPPTGNTCVSGMCLCGSRAACAAGEMCCAGSCANLASSDEHCGACGVACDVGAGQACVDGVCLVPACSPACAPGETCTGGGCSCGAVPACGAGSGCCGGTCLDLSSDDGNCGACGVVCGAGLTCTGGTCTSDAPCTPSCNPGESCVSGTCMCGTGGACPAGRSCCGGACRDTTRDVLACGMCGRECAATEGCCSGTCIDTTRTPSHCGSCGNVCNPDTADGCTAGRCTCAGDTECSMFFPRCYPGLGCGPE